MFELNRLDFRQINKSLPVYVMNNFYQNPDEILFYFNSTPPHPHKWALNTNNLNYFSDLRHNFNHADMKNVTERLISYFNLEGKKPHTKVTTNVFRMNCTKFNNYKDNYWAPHTDDLDGEVMTFLIYFNLEGCDGTNFYNAKRKFVGREHDSPWCSKNFYDLLLNAPSQYNMCLAFNTNITHGMAINDNTFFNKFRLNQAIFI